MSEAHSLTPELPGGLGAGPVHRKHDRFLATHAEPAASLDDEPPLPAERPAPAAQAVELTDRTRLGLAVLGGALALGVIADLLLRVTPWGLNLPLAIAALLGAGALIALRRGIALAGEGRWLVVPLLFFAGSVAWRDSGTLSIYNSLALLAALGLVGLYGRAGKVALGGFARYLVGVVQVALQLPVGPLILVVGDIRWRALGRAGWYGPTLAVLRGLLLGLPLLLVFGGLFMAADAAFEGLVTRIFRWNLLEIASHLVLVGLFGWCAAGLLRTALIADEWTDFDGLPSPFALGTVEIVLVLGLLNLLFLSFVIVQLPYLFGGISTVLAANGPTYSEYARRGFIELLTVAALALPVLVVGHWLVPRDNRAVERRFRRLAGVLVGLLFVVIVSALQRMRLYQEVYGMTEQRLYPTAFMLWLAVVFAWFVLTVLRGRRERFAFGALLSGFTMLALLTAFNPDDYIVRTNVERPNASRPFDYCYATSLSADAVPALIEVLPLVPEPARPAFARRLLDRWSAPVEQDLRSWNWGRYRAWLAVADNRGYLEALAGPLQSRASTACRGMR